MRNLAFWPIFSLILVAGCGGETERTPVLELVKQDVRAGTGAEAVAGRTVTVHYTGWLYDPSRPENKGDAVRQFTRRASPSPSASAADR